jgi:hypothetical protein
MPDCKSARPYEEPDIRVFHRYPLVRQPRLRPAWNRATPRQTPPRTYPLVRIVRKGMLLEAKRAGEALLVAKQQCKHGEFLPWLKANCEVNPRQAQRDMQVAKSVSGDAFDPDATIDSVLDVHACRRAEKPKATPFTRPDAEYAMKLHRMAEGTANENEAAVARTKLERSSRLVS